MTDATITRRDSLKRKSPHDGFDEPETKVCLQHAHNVPHSYLTRSDQDLGYPHVGTTVVI